MMKFFLLFLVIFFFAMTYAKSDSDGDGFERGFGGFERGGFGGFERGGFGGFERGRFGGFERGGFRGFEAFILKSIFLRNLSEVEVGGFV
jgi:hypothetical protein